MLIGERLKAARKELGLTQAAFAEQIGLKPTAILMYEKGSRKITEQSLALIRQKFHINEEWLRTGEGEMMAASANTVFDEFAQHYALTREEQATARFLLNLSRDERAAVLQYVKRLAAELAKIEE